MKHKLRCQFTQQTADEIPDTIKSELADLPMEMVSAEEAEQANAVVCVRAGEEAEHYKRDNVYTNCAWCGAAITHRPHVPAKPVKVCVECMIQKIQGDQLET